MRQNEELQEFLISKMVEIVKAKAMLINHPEIAENETLESLTIVRMVHWWAEYVINFKIVKNGRAFRPHFVIILGSDLNNSRLCAYNTTRVRV